MIRLPREVAELSFVMPLVPATQRGPRHRAREHVDMIAAAAQPAIATAPTLPPAHNVREGFDLIWGKLDGWGNEFILFIPNLILGVIVALIFVALAWALGVLLRQAVTRAGRHDLAHMLASFAFWVTLFIGFLAVLTVLLPSMQPGDVFTSLGVGSVALGFAFKDILQNFIAGFFILIRRPFQRGDQIKVGDIEGTVQAVETRATLVKTYSGRLVIIPNSDIYTRSVTVHTAYETRRMEVVVPVDLEVDIDQAIDAFRKAVLGVEHVLADPPPDFLPWEFKDNNVNIRVRWWTKSQRSYEVRTRAAIVSAIKLATEEAGIALPADTKISFAETPLVIAQQKAAKAKPKQPQRKAKKPAPVKEPTPAEEARDPEAEKPKLGELNEGVEELPR
jgi:small-conductance mechanosensitive channel